MRAVRCTRRYCGTLYDLTTDGQGRVVGSCPACARNKAGRCRECPAPLADPRAMRCPRCAKRHALALDRVHDRERYARRQAAKREQGRRRRADPVHRERRRQYMAAYRAAHPRDWADRAYQRAYMKRLRRDPAYHAHELAYKRAYRERKRAERQAVA